MKLFSRFNKKDKTIHNPLPNEKFAVKTWRFAQSENHDGFEEVALFIDGFKPIEENIEEIQIKNPNFKIGSEEPEFVFDFADKTVLLMLFNFQTSEIKIPYIFIYVDNRHLGAWDCSESTELVKHLINDEVEKVHLSIKWNPKLILIKDKKERTKISHVEKYEVKLFLKMS